MGARLRKRRESEGLSIAQVARRVDCELSFIEEIELGSDPLHLNLAKWIDLVWATRSPWPDERRNRNTGAGDFGWTGYSRLEAAEAFVQRHLDGKEDLSTEPLSRWTYDVTYTFSGASDLGDLPYDVKVALDAVTDVVAGNVTTRPLNDNESDGGGGVILQYEIEVTAKEETTAFGAVQGATARAMTYASRPDQVGERRRVPRYHRDIRLRGSAEPIPPT
jgi:transcriptional regulator with XRE-family HTH domain